MNSTGLRLFLAVASLAFAFVLMPSTKPALNRTVASHRPRQLKVPTIEASENTAAKAQWDLLRLRDPATGQIPENVRAHELEFATTLPIRSDMSFKSGSGSFVQDAPTNWRAAGPGNVGGRTQCIQFDISNSNTILAASAQGGVWRTTNLGTTWSCTTLPTQRHDATSLAQDTRPGKQNIWYYGTGELLSTTLRRVSVVDTPRYRTQEIGDGMYKSTDSGKTWNALSATVTTAGFNNNVTSLTNPFEGIWEIVTDSHTTEADIIYAATYGAIMRSTDGGNSWTSVLGGSSNVSFCSDIVISSTGILYAAMSSYTLSGQSSTNAGIYRSTDGTTWTKISPTTGWPGQTRRMKLALAPSNENVLYALMETPGSGTSDHSIWKYTYQTGNGSGAGGTWDDRSANIPDNPNNSGDLINFNSLGGYALVVKVKPDNENMVFIGGTNIHCSTDGFATAGNVHWVGGYNNGSTGTYFTDHPDNHTFTFSPSNSNEMIAGNDGGVFIAQNVSSPDSISWYPLNNGYVNTMFYSVSMDHKASGDNYILGGLQDNYSWSGWDTSHDWQNVGEGDGCYSGVSDGKSYVYTSSQFAFILRLGLDAQQNDTNYSIISPYDPTFTFVAPWQLDPNNTNTMYLAGGQMLWYNSDLAGMPIDTTGYSSVNWTQLTSTQLPDTSIIGCLSVSNSPIERVYYGTSNGRIFRLDNATSLTAKPKEITSSIFPKGAFVANVAIDRENADNIIAVFSNYHVQSLFASSDGGATWRNISGNLEQNPDGSGDGPSCRWAAIIHHGIATTYYVGTSIGLFSTSDISGANPNWSQEGANTIGNVTVEMIDFRETDGLIAVATQGHGVFTATAPSAVSASSLSLEADHLGANYPNPAKTETTIPFSLASDEHVSLSVYDVAGNSVETLCDANFTAGAHQVSLDTKALPTGTYYYRMVANARMQSAQMTVLH
jgi:photosystem II stability/assembly factor-like uncharacterized protein